MKNRLREIRTQKGLTRGKLANLTGLTERAIKHYEDGSVPLEKAAYMSVVALAQALEVHPLELFVIEDPLE